jgi:hypothetical protein
MNTLKSAVLLVACAAAPLLAGAFVFEVGNPLANPEAKAKGAVLVARITSCHAPEKSIVTATAEGYVHGVRKSIPLTLIPLSSQGEFAVRHDWPATGTWVIRLVAANPEYKDIRRGLLVSMNGDTFERSSVKRFDREPLSQDADAVLNPTASR